MESLKAILLCSRQWARSRLQSLRRPHPFRHQPDDDADRARRCRVGWRMQREQQADEPEPKVRSCERRTRPRQRRQQGLRQARAWRSRRKLRASLSLIWRWLSDRSSATARLMRTHEIAPGKMAKQTGGLAAAHIEMACTAPQVRIDTGRNTSRVRSQPRLFIAYGSTRKAAKRRFPIEAKIEVAEPEFTG